MNATAASSLSNSIEWTQSPGVSAKDGSSRVALNTDLSGKHSQGSKAADGEFAALMAESMGTMTPVPQAGTQAWRMPDLRSLAKLDPTGPPSSISESSIPDFSAGVAQPLESDLTGTHLLPSSMATTGVAPWLGSLLSTPAIPAAATTTDPAPGLPKAVGPFRFSTPILSSPRVTGAGISNSPISKNTVSMNTVSTDLVSKNLAKDAAVPLAAPEARARDFSSLVAPKSGLDGSVPRAAAVQLQHVESSNDTKATADPVDPQSAREPVPAGTSEGSPSASSTGASKGTRAKAQDQEPQGNAPLTPNQFPVMQILTAVPPGVAAPSALPPSTVAKVSITSSSEAQVKESGPTAAALPLDSAQTAALPLDDARNAAIPLPPQAAQSTATARGKSNDPKTGDEAHGKVRSQGPAVEPANAGVLQPVSHPNAAAEKAVASQEQASHGANAEILLPELGLPGTVGSGAKTPMRTAVDLRLREKQSTAADSSQAASSSESSPVSFRMSGTPLVEASAQTLKHDMTGALSHSKIDTGSPALPTQTSAETSGESGHPAAVPVAVVNVRQDLHREPSIPLSTTMTEPVVPEKFTQTQPMRSFSLEFTPDGAKDVRLHVSQSGGAVHVALKSSDETLSGKLRDGVQDLVGSLSNAGYDADAWTPRDGGNRQHQQEPDPAEIKPKRTAGSDAAFDQIMQTQPKENL